MIRVALIALTLSGCASAYQLPPGEAHLSAWLAPFCFFNCVISVTYAPGVESLRAGDVYDRRRRGE